MNPVVKRTYRPNSDGERFHLCNKRIRGLMGPVGTGKTVTGCAEIKFRAEAQLPGPDGIRPTKFVIVRNTMKQLNMTTMATWRQWFPEVVFPIRQTPYPSCKFHYDLRDGTRVESEVIFLALDHPDHVADLRSFEITGGYINEASEIPEWVYKILLERVGRFPPPLIAPYTWDGVWMDTNPPPTNHWYYELAEVRGLTDPDFKESSKFIKYLEPPLLGDKENGFIPNPNCDYHQFQAKGYDYWLDIAKVQKQDYIDVMIMGQYGSIVSGKVVYTEFMESCHVSHEIIKPDPRSPIIVGWDYGINGNAAVFCQHLHGDRFFVIDECFSEDLNLIQFITDIVRPKMSQDYIGCSFIHIGDPSGTSRSNTNVQSAGAQDILRQHGFPCYSLPESQKPLKRINAVSSFMTPLSEMYSRFLVSPICELLIRGFRGDYKYPLIKASGDARYKDKPLKNDVSHPHDGLQYAAYYAQNPDSFNVVAAQEVITPDYGAFT